MAHTKRDREQESIERQANEELVRMDNAELDRQMAETGDESGIEDGQEANTPTVPVVFSEPPTNLQLAERALQLLEAADEDHGLDEDEDAAAGLVRELVSRLTRMSARRDTSRWCPSGQSAHIQEASNGKQQEHTRQGSKRTTHNQHYDTSGQ